LLDLGPYIRRDEAEFQSKDWFPEAFAVGTWAGKQYGIPTDINVSNIYYNQSLFDSAGVKYPTDAWTYSDYLAAAVRLARGEGANRVWGTSLVEVMPHAPAVWANGGRLYDESFTRSLLDQPAAIDALQWVADLRWKHAVAPRPDEMTGTNERGLWEAGRIAMVFNGTHFLGNTRLKEVGFAWDVALAPKGAVRRSGLVRMAVCAMVADAPHPAAAWLLTKHLSSPAAQRAWATTGSLMPARKSIASSQAFVRRPPASVEKVVEGANYSRGDEYHHKWAEANRMISESLGLAINQGKQTVRASVTDLVPRLNALLRS
jgi:multiple sugar transport system substrate-binding protein